MDLNCDLGEGAGNDSLIIPLISSANVSCGLHAGTESDIRETVRLCLQHNVRVGAHPSFDDRINFGRVEMVLSDQSLYDLIGSQLEFLSGICKDLGIPMIHVKPHGALYNMLARDSSMSAVTAACIRDFDPDLIVFGLSGSVFLSVASELGLAVKHEVFADRTYRDDGSLTPRSMPYALITDQRQMEEQVLEMIFKQVVTTTSGKKINLRSETLCLHGDGPDAVQFVWAIRDLLLNNGIQII